VSHPLSLEGGPPRVVLFVKRWDESVRFYTEALGLVPAYPVRRGWAEFRVGPLALCLQEGRASDVATEEVCKVGWRVADLDGAREALLGRGVSVSEPRPFGGIRICDFYDPDDNALFLEGA
jgi:catechol 2,3-dioxygenase-like lactoylglutathione lyase family enzyme